MHTQSRSQPSVSYFAYFIKVSHVHLHVRIRKCCLQRYLVSLQEKAIKTHVANGAGVDFPSFILPSEAGWRLQELPSCKRGCSSSSVLSLRFIQGPQWFCATLCCTRAPTGLQDHGATWGTGGQIAQSAQVSRELICCRQQAALICVCFTLPGNFPLYRGLYITILLFFLCFSLTVLVLRLVFLAILETFLN